VTVGGQSAGSTSTAANVISPASAGLLHRAIFESGPLLTVAPLALAEQRGADFAKAAGCGTDASAQAAACLRALSVDKILSLQGTAAANGPYINGLMVDGTILPISGDEAWRTGKFNHMPIMNGPVADEGAFTASIDELFFGPMTVERFTKLVNTTYGGPAGPGSGPPNYPDGTPARVTAQYPLDAYPTPGAAWTAIATDSNVCRHPYLNNHVAEFVPLYAYEFTYKKAPWYFPAVHFDHGAAHTIDIQFLFPDWHGGPLGIQHGLSAQEHALSRELVTAWTNFMYTGNPNLKGDRPWPRYAKGSEVYLSQNVTGLTPITAAQFATEHKCGFWDQILIYETPGRS
jgi:para-nitrobenzyl esterase